MHFHESFEDHQANMGRKAGVTELSEIKEETAQTLLKELREMKLFLSDLQRRELSYVGSK